MSISQADLQQIRSLPAEETALTLVRNEHAWEAWDDPLDMIRAAAMVSVPKRVMAMAAVECVEWGLRFVPKGTTAPHEAVRLARAWAEGNDVPREDLYRARMLCYYLYSDTIDRSFAEAANAASLLADTLQNVRSDGVFWSVWFGQEMQVVVDKVAWAQAYKTAETRYDPRWAEARRRVLAGFAKHMRREDDGPLRWEVIDAAVGDLG